MTKKELTKILKKIYSEPMVKVVRTGKVRPSYDKMLILKKQGIPLEAWEDIREWLNKKATQ